MLVLGAAFLIAANYLLPVTCPVLCRVLTVLCRVLSLRGRRELLTACEDGTLSRPDPALGADGRMILRVSVWGCSLASGRGCGLTGFLSAAFLHNHVYFMKMAARGTL